MEHFEWSIDNIREWPYSLALSQHGAFMKALNSIWEISD